MTEPAGGTVRRYSGTTVASDTSALKFSVSGTVASVEVSQGDRITAGQILATLDPKPFDLDVQAAEAELASTEANTVEKESALMRQRQLSEKGWVAKAALDQAIAAFDAAKGELNLARSRLGTAERNCRCRGRITEIGSSAGTANSVPVTAALLDGLSDLLPGMSAEVTLTVSEADDTGGFLVPIPAIAPGDDTAPGYIFKFDPAERVVRKVAVRAGDGVFENLVSIAEGVIAFGLVVGTAITLGFVPVLYTILYRIPIRAARDTVAPAAMEAG